MPFYWCLLTSRIFLMLCQHQKSQRNWDSVHYEDESGIFRAHVPHKEQDYTKDLIGSRMSCLTNEKPCCVRNKEFPCRFAFICSSIQPLAILRSEQKCCQKTLWGKFMYCVHWKIIRQTLVSPYRRDRGRLCHHY